MTIQCQAVIETLTTKLISAGFCFAIIVESCVLYLLARWRFSRSMLADIAPHLGEMQVLVIFQRLDQAASLGMEEIERIEALELGKQLARLRHLSFDSASAVKTVAGRRVQTSAVVAAIAHFSGRKISKEVAEALPPLASIADFLVDWFEFNGVQFGIAARRHLQANAGSFCLMYGTYSATPLAQRESWTRNLIKQQNSLRKRTRSMKRQLQWNQYVHERRDRFIVIRLLMSLHSDRSN